MRQIILLTLFLPVFAAASPTHVKKELSLPTAETILGEDFEGFEVVHRLRYPMKNKIMIETHYGYLSGDKFLNTDSRGVGLSYYFNQRLAAKSTVAFHRNFVKSDVGVLKGQGINPEFSNPDATLRVGILYQPIYGKFTTNNFIQSYYIGFELGVLASREQLFIYQGVNDVNPNLEDVRFGPYAGINFVFPVSDFYSINFNTNYSLYQGISQYEQKNKNLWMNNLSVGIRF